MTNTILYIAWAALYVICGILGIHSIPGWVGVLACVCFFIPPALLLWQAARAGDLKTVRRVRNLALAWLGATLLLLIVNILSVALSAAAGTVLYYILVLVSSPMICGQQWIVSMFLWSFVLMSSLRMLKPRKY